MIISTEPNPSKPSVKYDSQETKLTRNEILQIISKKRWNMPTGDMVEFPPLNCRVDLAAWIARVEEDLMTGDAIPRSQWADAAILYLGGYEPLNILMRQQRARRINSGGLDIWIWEDFQESLSQVLEERDCSRTGLQRFREDHPIAVTVATAGLVTAGSLFLAPAIIVGGLNAVGFTASGVAGGSIATGLQSSVYGGLTTGLFSACQSIGATGVVGSLGTGSIISGIGSLAGATILGSSSRKTKTGGSDSKSEASDLAGGNGSTSPPPYS